MKKQTNKTASSFSKVISLALALVFFFITAVQAFHNHTFQPANDDADGQEYVFASEKCSVCDYVIHKQTDHAQHSYPPVLVAPVTKPVTLLSRYYAGIYKFTLQGFTNKGPPAVCC